MYIDLNNAFLLNSQGRRGHDHMVVGFTTSCAISAYHHWSCEFGTPFMARCTQYNIMW